MERRSFLQITTASSLLGATTAATDSKSDAKSTIGLPVAMAPRHDGIEIIWRTRELSRGYIEFGTTAELGSVKRDDGWGLRPAGAESIRVRLDGLKPGTTYHYRAVTENMDHKNPSRSNSEIRTFRTLDPKAATTRFAVWNDTHKHVETIQRLNQLTPESDFLLWNGDICNDWYREGEVADTILQPAPGVDHSAGHPLLLVRGNHDSRGTLAYQLEQHAPMPEKYPWFVLRSGPVAAICLDTGEDKPDDHPNLLGRAASEPMREAQAEWLKEVIARPEIRDAPYRLVFCHIPLRWTDEETDFGYDWYSKRSRDLWHDSLVKWGAQLVVSGHTHREGLVPSSKEFPYLQLVGGGPKMAQARLIQAEANDKELLIKIIDMDGSVTRKLTLNPVE